MLEPLAISPNQISFLSKAVPKIQIITGEILINIILVSSMDLLDGSMVMIPYMELFLFQTILSMSTFGTIKEATRFSSPMLHQMFQEGDMSLETRGVEER